MCAIAHGASRYAISRVRYKIALGRLAKRHGLGHFQRSGGLCCLPSLDRVDAVEQLKPRRLGALAGLFQANRVQRAESEHALAASDLITEKPRRGAGARDLQIEAMPVGIPADSFAQPGDPFRG